ncbi:MAG: hypothetical protein ACK452_17090, partial [Bacteroidota bacterium]
SQAFSYCPGDSVHLAISNYTGALQWQQSTDSVNWTDIPGATISPYGFAFSTSKYYRAKVTATNCNPVYSQLQHAVYSGNCQYAEGSVFCNGPTAVVDVLNPITGKTWMDRNIGAAQVATSSADSLSYGDLYQWGRGSDGHQCRTSPTITTLSSSNQPANGDFILAPANPSDWRNPQNAILWQGLNGVNNPCPIGYRLPTETEWSAEDASFSTQNDSGAFNSPLKLSVAGYRDLANGSLLNVGANGYFWSCTVSSTNSRRLFFNNSNSLMLSSFRANGFSVRCIKEPGSIGALNCGGNTVIGNLISGQAAINVSVSIPYSGGNGDFYYSQSINSTGVTGLNISINGGNFVIGNGTLVYSMTGTPSANGTASFAINIGGQSCNLNVTVYPPQPSYPAGSVFCNGTPTFVVEVTNPATGKIWMDRNLGASQTASSSTDVSAYGDLYQWGRGNDGHQCRTSATISTLSSSDQPGNSSFILVTNAPGDWRNPQNANLWQGVNGINNPCPFGFRLPTEIELDSERISWSTNNISGGFLAPLKFTLGGFRQSNNGAVVNVGFYSIYWSSTVMGNDSRILYLNNLDADLGINLRGDGISVRCIKN